MERYVAQVDIPVPVYGSTSERKPLGNAPYYGCIKGYWYVFFEEDSLGTERPLGIRLIIEFYAEDRESAEDQAMHSAARLATVTGAYSGSPLPSPKLQRLGRIGPANGILEQYDYYYLEGPEALPRVLLRPHHLENLISWYGDLTSQASDRLEQAARWYGMSLRAEDPLDGYLSAWIGLESVGPVLAKRVHEFGEKAPCHVCNNQPGKDRDEGEAAIEHAIRAVAPELLVDQSIQALKDVRNDIAHVLKPMQSLRPRAQDYLPDLQLSLIFGILTAVRPENVAPRAGRAILPRDFRPYPEARASVRSPVELIKHQPFFGEWLTVKRSFSNEKTRLEQDGCYIWGARTGLFVSGSAPPDTPLERQYVMFERMGRSWENLESDQDLPAIPVVPWRSTPVSPAWQRYLGADQD